MPTYEYACESCGNHIEVYQKFSDEPMTECGICGGRLRKVFHPAGILFKGSGFYVTDSRSGRSGGSGTKKETAGAASGDSSGGTGSGSSGGSGSGTTGGSKGGADTSGSSSASPTKEKSA